MKKKVLFFLITLMVLLIPKVTHADSRQFYEAEYIDGTYISKLAPDKKITYYQKVKVIRDSATNQYAYCIEPFSLFYGENTYNSSQIPYNLTKEKVDEISIIAHFGYGYKNHTDLKWYAVTQLMIWQVVEPNGTYYFTDTLNGNKITPYNNEINEIHDLINNYKKNISFNNSTYDLVENEELIIKDTNNVLNTLKTNNPYVSVENNTLKVTNLPIGKTTIDFSYQDNYYNQPILFYQSYNSQNLVENGNLTDKKASITVNVQKTSITINKLDKDTDSTTNSGEAILSGAIYQLYDKDMNEIAKLEIENNKAVINNLAYGKYYLKEIKAGTGYTIDETVHEINITKDNPQIIIDLYNEVIKAKLIINKEYELDNTTAKEDNISFNIYNNKNELVTTLITNEQGHAEIILPYGTYNIVQATTKEGYQLVEPFNVIIKDDTEITYDLINYKIPDTSTNFLKYIIILIKRISLILCINIL